MKKLVLFFAIATLSSCALTLPVAVTSNPIPEKPKVGTSTALAWFGFIYYPGDASVQTAAKNGDIKKISTVDIRVLRVFGIPVSYTTTVTGE